MIPSNRRVKISNPASGSTAGYTSRKKAEKYVKGGRAFLSPDGSTLTFLMAHEAHRAVLRHCRSHPIAHKPNVPHTNFLRVPVRSGPRMTIVDMVEAFELLSDPFKGMPVLPPSPEYLNNLLTLDKNRRLRP